MKKLYSFLMAAAVTVSAVAATPVLAPKAKVAGAFELKKSPLAVTVAAPVKVQSIAAKADAEASEFPASLEGKKFAFSYDLVDYDTQGNATTYPMSNTLLFEDEEVNEDGTLEYVVSGLGEGIFNEAITVNEVLMTYDPTIGRLEFMANQPLFESAQYQLTLTVYTMGEGNSIYPGLPTLFVWKDGGFEWIKEYTVNSSEGTVDFKTQGFVVCDSQYNSYGEFTNLAMYAMNGEMSTKVFINPDKTINSVDPVYAEYTTEGLVITDWFGIGFDAQNAVTFAVDTQAKTVTATATLISYSGYNLALLDATNDLSDAEKYSASIKGDDLTLNGTYTVENGVTTLLVNDWNGFLVQGTSLYDAAMWYPISDTKLVLDFDVEEAIAGVNDVVAPEAVDTNAPVEYYNLQGVRVAEPAAGLYIRRQGNVATKVLVK